MPSVEDFAGDSDYTLRWPPDIFADELMRLIVRSEQGHTEWTEEVECLLRQAFVSSSPLEEFRRLTNLTAPPTDDDVPF